MRVADTSNMFRFRIAVFLVTASIMAIDLQASRHRAAAGPPYIPQPKHVIVVILENEDVAARDQPFLGELAREGALLTNYHGLTHPSQPNYVALFAGSAYGITDDNPVTIDVRNLADLLEANGATWKVYAEDYPGDCFLGSSAAGGLYVRRHVPFIEFTDIQQEASRCANIVNATQLNADIAAGALPSFALYVPNNQHNGHDTSLAVADQWLEQTFEPLLGDERFITDTLLVVTFDESNSPSNNTVSALFYGAMVQHGSQSDHYYDHYSLLRTIEAIIGTGSLGKHDARADEIIGIWR